MKFLENWTINLSKIPKYPELKKPIKEKCEEELFRLCLEKLTEQDRKISEGYLKGVKNNERNTYYNNRYDCGRYYPNTINGNHTGIILLKRSLKNTIFKFLNWIDIDQKKGHPTILIELAEKNGIDLKYYKRYINNFEDIVKQLSEFYTLDEDKPITKKEIKLLFNLTIYGGGFETWKEQLKEDGFKIDNEEVKHSFYKKFKKETKMITNIIYENNNELINKVCVDENMSEYEKKNKVMAFFLWNYRK